MWNAAIPVLAKLLEAQRPNLLLSSDMRVFLNLKEEELEVPVSP